MKNLGWDGKWNWTDLILSLLDSAGSLRFVAGHKIDIKTQATRPMALITRVSMHKKYSIMK